MHYVTEIEFSLGFADCVSSRGSETRSALRRLPSTRHVQFISFLLLGTNNRADLLYDFVLYEPDFKMFVHTVSQNCTLWAKVKNRTNN
jgi:hypothetical protein